MAINRMLVFMAGLVMTTSVFGELRSEDLQLIERTFASTNKAWQVNRMTYSMFSNCWYGAYQRESAYARELQYNLLTNICQFKSRDIDYWADSNIDDRSSMFAKLCCYSCNSNDLRYIEVLADFLGTEMVQLPIESLTNEAPWRIEIYNSEIECGRRTMIEFFSRLVQRYERYISVDEKSPFRSNTVERALLTEEERRIVWPAQ